MVDPLLSTRKIAIFSAVVFGLGGLVPWFQYPLSGCLVVSGFPNQNCFGMHVVECLVGFVKSVIGFFFLFSVFHELFKAFNTLNFNEE